MATVIDMFTYFDELSKRIWTTLFSSQDVPNPPKGNHRD